MFAEILLAIATVAVAVMVSVDLVRTKTDDPSGQHDGSGYEVRPAREGHIRSGPIVPRIVSAGTPEG